LALLIALVFLLSKALRRSCFFWSAPESNRQFLKCVDETVTPRLKTDRCRDLVAPPIEPDEARIRPQKCPVALGAHPAYFPGAPKRLASVGPP
jgi:hypothetical protein